ncbi:MAG TPA: hypothetical protein VL326_14455 [Kofleriaceae bacterium]|nr:hypothetical protein [Kofleriaceae bacterium]
MRWFALALLVLAATRAHADNIALVSDDSAFRGALVDAGDTVLVTAEKPPGVGDLASASRAIADRLGATVTVWLIASGTTTSLVTYDRVADRVIVRELPYGLPLDPARATEAARIVRTMLRSMRTPDVEDKIATPPPPPPPPLPREPQFEVSAGGGVWVAAAGAVASPAVTLTTAWRPHGLGAAVQATVAPAAEIAMPAFTGDVRDVVLAGIVRNALALPGAENTRMVPSVGVALHMLHLAGNTADSRRFDPAIRVGLGALRELPHDLEVGLDVSADCLLQRQVYESGTEEILAVPRVQIVAAVVIGIRL